LEKTYMGVANKGKPTGLRLMFNQGNSVGRADSTTLFENYCGLPLVDDDVANGPATTTAAAVGAMFTGQRADAPSSAVPTIAPIGGTCSAECDVFSTPSIAMIAAIEVSSAFAASAAVCGQRGRVFNHNGPIKSNETSGSTATPAPVASRNCAEPSRSTSVNGASDSNGAGCCKNDCTTAAAWGVSLLSVLAFTAITAGTATVHEHWNTDGIAPFSTDIYVTQVAATVTPWWAFERKSTTTTTTAATTLKQAAGAVLRRVAV
jgi:hypothetical protein